MVNAKIEATSVIGQRSSSPPNKQNEVTDINQASKDKKTWV